MIRGLDNEVKYMDREYDVFNFEMYSWIAVPPDYKFMMDNDLHEEYLNKLIINHRIDFKFHNELYEIRKRFLVNNKIEEDLYNDEEEELCEDDQIIQENNGERDWEYNEDLTENFFQTKEIDENEKKYNSEQKYNYAIINIVGTKKSGWGLKIRGLFKNEEEARNQANILKDSDTLFDHFVVEMYKWIPFDIDINKIGESIYPDEKLNNMFIEHDKQQIKAKQHLENNPPQIEEICTATKLLNDLEKN